MISATPVNDADNLLDLQSVTKAYRLETKQFLAVKDINLHIKAGEFVCLLGPSGCGKSTLLRIIAGLNAATSGVVSYHGQPLKGVNPYTTIVFQTFALYPWLTVQENVEIALKARGVSVAERTERALKLIDTVGLDGFESAYPRELSGGMRQKVGFARAMAVACRPAGEIGGGRRTSRSLPDGRRSGPRTGRPLAHRRGRRPAGFYNCA
jgi:NitT/TauT family transport system ATP-binding protein